MLFIMTACGERKEGEERGGLRASGIVYGTGFEKKNSTENIFSDAVLNI